MDLSIMDLNKGDAVKLDGEWEFYWNQLLEPGGIKPGAQDGRSFIKVPGSWNGYFFEGNKLPGDGFATYRLSVKLKDYKDNIYAIKMGSFSSSYKLWIDRRFMASNGIVGEDRKSAVPEYIPEIVVFKPMSENVEIVIQVSNFSHTKGGMRNSIYIGGIQQISKLGSEKLAFQIFGFGSLLIMGIYHLIIYMNRKKDRSTLYFGLLCIAMGIRTLFSGELAAGEWFPVLDWEACKKIEYLAFYCTLPMGVSFLRSLYPDEISSFIKRVAGATSIVLACIALLASARVYTGLNTIYQGIIVLCGIYVVYGLIKAAVRKRDGAVWVLICGVIFVAAVVNDILVNNEVINSFSLSATGMLFFILGQSFLLSIKSSRTFFRAEMLAAENSRLARETQELNRDLEEKIDERTYLLKETITKLNDEIKAHKETEEKLSVYATTDIMTGFLNRGTGLTLLEEQIKLSKRSGSHLTVCFIDVNDLKKVNDSFGHAYGDELIITVCKIIKECIRESDIVCRVGGDEFLIIFPQCTAAQASAVWERISDRLYELNESKDKKYGIYVSHGFAEYDGSDTMSAGELIDKADSEMYKKKRILKRHR